LAYFLRLKASQRLNRGSGFRRRIVPKPEIDALHLYRE
jgi:hypothetical protein